LFAAWFEQTNRKPMAPAIVTPLDIRQYRQSLVDSKKAVGTVNGKLKALRVFFDWAKLQGLVSANPTAKVKGLKQVKRAPRWLTRQETYAVLRATEESVQVAELKGNLPTAYIARRNVAAVALMLHAGLRVAEVARLTRQDVTIKARSGKVIVRHGKGGKYREVPLNADARQAVESWLEACKDDKHLFANRRNGQPLHTYSLQHALTRLGRAARLPERLTPHRLRHTFGKSLVDAGVSLDRVAMLLGHTRLDTTAIYTMPSLADLESEVDRIAWQD
jgi:integrase/recombinase XerC